MTRPRTLARLLIGLAGMLMVLGLVLPMAQAQVAGSPDAALQRLLEAARSGMPGSCTQADADRLIRILCAKRIRIGVRDYYPLFGTRSGDKREGYEVDVGLAIGQMLGVEVEFVRVNAATRIPLLAEDRIDLVIATMGHNTQRDSQVRFIRPHYYQSETIVVGPRDLPVASMADLPGRTVCVTIGNGSNAQMVSQGARLMLFDEAGVLPDRLRDGTCSLAAQDDSFFANYFKEPDFSAAFAPKFGFAQVPWGMAVARQGSEQLARAIDLIMQIFHRDGVFIDIGRSHRVGVAFLEGQQKLWRSPQCNTDTGSTTPACILPPLDAALTPTSFAPEVTALENWVENRAGFDLTLPMLKTAPAWSMFKDGVINSLILIAGALIATFVLAVLFGGAMAARTIVVRWPARVFTVALQSSPIVLTLVIAAVIAHALFPYSGAVALGAAIAALGLANGCNAGQALAEAVWSLRAEQGTGTIRGSGAGVLRGKALFGRALGRSATQIVAFLVNAAKGTPIASFIGAPELLGTLTDITSFASGRVTTYSLLLVFYTVVVIIVVWLCGKLRVYLESRQARGDDDASKVPA